MYTVMEAPHVHGTLYYTTRTRLLGRGDTTKLTTCTYVYTAVVGMKH